MNTARTRSTLPAWGALLVSSAVVVAGCTSAPVATGTLPPTTPPTTSPTTSNPASSNPDSFSPSSTIPAPSSPASSSALSPAEPPPPTSQNAFPGTEAAEVDPGPVIATAPTDAPTSPAVAQGPTLVVPAGATQKTVGGARDFVQWWFELGTASLAEKNNANLEEYSSASCQECSDLISRNQRSIAAGEGVALKGDSWINVIQADLTSQDIVTMVVIRYVPPIDYLAANGTITETVDATAYMVGIDVIWHNGHWSMGPTREVQQ